MVVACSFYLAELQGNCIFTFGTAMVNVWTSLFDGGPFFPQCSQCIIIPVAFVEQVTAVVWTMSVMNPFYKHGWFKMVNTIQFPLDGCVHAILATIHNGDTTYATLVYRTVKLFAQMRNHGVNGIQGLQRHEL